MSQKLVQFRGLCDKNIAAMDPNAEHDPFVPTSEDLAGFWDMVYIQVLYKYYEMNGKSNLLLLSNEFYIP